MRICFCICGQPRNIKLIIDNINQTYKNYDYDIYLCLSKNSDIYEKEYLNDVNLDSIYNNDKIKKILLVNDLHEDLFRNSLNYLYKIYNIIPLIPNNYNFYVILRSDFIFINTLNFNDLSDNIIYASNKSNNQYVKLIKDKINSDIIIIPNYTTFIKFKNIYEYGREFNSYMDCILFNFLKNNLMDNREINIEYKLILSLCNIIAIAGDSGSGKSTLLNILLPLFDNTNLLKFETDRYHKWERGDKNYDLYTHLHPYANYLEKMSEDVYNLKIGNEIYAVNYDHNNGKFTKEEMVESKSNIILCGLHTLTNNINLYTDLKIFLDTDRALVRKWKIERDQNERSHSIDRIIKQIEKRENDYKIYIETQRNNADIIIRYYEDINQQNKLCCTMEICNNNIINKIIKYLIKYNYKYFIIHNDHLLIHLIGSLQNIDLQFIKEKFNYTNNLENNYNGEIQSMFILILFDTH